MADSLMYGGQKVTPEKRPGVYVRPSDVSSGARYLGAQLNKQEGVFGTLLEDHNKELGNNRVLERAAKANDSIRGIRKSLMQRKGNAANGIVEEADDAIGQLTSEAVNEPGLTERDKTNLNALMLRYRRGTLDVLANHVTKETAEATIANNIMVSRQHLEILEGNPNLAQEKQVIEVLDGLAKKEVPRGEEPGPTVKLKLQNNRAVARETTIRSLINRGDKKSLEDARDLLDREKKKVSLEEVKAGVGGVLPIRNEQRLESMYEGAMNELRGVEWQVDVESLVSRVWQSDGTPEQKLAFLRDPANIPDRKTRERAVAMYRQMERKRVTEVDAARFNQVQQGMDIWITNPTVDTIPSFLSEAEQKKAEVLSVRLATGKPIENDYAAMQKLQDSLDNNIEKFKKTNLQLEYGTKLDTSTMTYYRSLQRELRGGGGSNKVHRLVSVNQRIKNTMMAIDKDPTPDSKEEVAVYNEFYGFVAREIHSGGWNMDTVPDEELQRILREAIVYGEWNAPWTPGWDTNLYWFEAKPGSPAAEGFYFTDIPIEMQQAINAELKKDDGIRRPTNQQITRRWMEKIRTGEVVP